MLRPLKPLPLDPQDIEVYYVSDGGHGSDQDIIFSGKK